jgi:hypothetical protein
MKLNLILMFFLAFVSCSVAFPEAKMVSKDQRGPGCDLCKYVIGQLEISLNSDATEDQIMEAAKAVCTALGEFDENVATACQDFVDNNLPQIIDLILLAVAPETICQGLNVCPKP